MMCSPIANVVVSLFLFDLSDSKLLRRLLCTLSNGRDCLGYSFVKMQLLLERPSSRGNFNRFLKSKFGENTAGSLFQVCVRDSILA